MHITTYFSILEFQIYICPSRKNPILPLFIICIFSNDALHANFFDLKFCLCTVQPVSNSKYPFKNISSILVQYRICTCTAFNLLTMASKNPIFAILWLALLIFIGWPLAIACSIVWILIQPIEACFPDPFKSINRFFGKLIARHRREKESLVT